MALPEVRRSLCWPNLIGSALMRKPVHDQKAIKESVKFLHLFYKGNSIYLVDKRICIGLFVFLMDSYRYLWILHFNRMHRFL